VKVRKAGDRRLGEQRKKPGWCSPGSWTGSVILSKTIRIQVSYLANEGYIIR
jgi:hypothetical protein